MKKWIVGLIVMLGVGFIAVGVLDRSEQHSSVAPAKASPSPTPAAATPDPRALEWERARGERTAHAKATVSALSQVDVPADKLTKAQAETRRRDLLALLADGKEAVPAIAEFFQKNTNPPLRLALIKVLFDIPTPDNVDLQLHVLNVATDAKEVALLAQQLEMQEPAKHREAIEAAKRRLR